MTTRNVLLAGLLGTLALLVATLATSSAAWLPIVLAVFAIVEAVALALEVRRA